MKNEAFEAALGRRLGKLSTLPVEMEGIEREVQRQVAGIKVQAPGQEHEVFGAGSGAAEVGAARVYRFPRRWRTVVGIAASIALVAIVGLALLQSRPAEASQMVQLHRDIVAGKIATMKVDSIAEVNEAFAAFGRHGIRMSAPEMHVMACCMQNVGNKQVYCVLLNDGGVPVTLTIAELGAVQAARGRVVMRNGEAFHLATSAELTMVTVDRGGLRLCLIGAAAAERLMGLTEGLRF
jgi:hypothetical protein